MAKKEATYEVVVTRDEDGWFVAEVPALDGCHTHGRSIAQAVNRAREAMGLFDVPPTAPITISLKAPVGKRIKRLLELRARSEAVAREAQEETQKVATELVSQGFSVRDVGELLDVSHQRVQQLVKG